MLSKFLTLLGLTAAFIFLLSQQVNAIASLRVIPNPTEARQKVTVYGSGFCGVSCSNITLSFSGQVISNNIVASNSGTFAFSFVNNFNPDQYNVIATQTDAHNQIIQASTGMIVGAADYPPQPSSNSQNQSNNSSPQNNYKILPNGSYKTIYNSTSNYFKWLIAGTILLALVIAIYVYKRKALTKLKR